MGLYTVPCKVYINISKYSNVYQDSNVENSIEVAIPPNILPMKRMLKSGDSLVKQQNV